MTENELVELHKMLKESKAGLLNSGDMKDEAAQTVVLDQSSVGRLSRMDAMQSQAMAQELLRRNRRQLAQIDQALLRVEGGDYGFCTGCDEEIDVRRLRFNPATPYCVKCAENVPDTL